MIHLHETLYGLNKDKTFKVWEIKVWNNEDGGGVLYIRHGKEGGKLQEKMEIFSEGHQGRNAVEQAVLEAKARVKKQLDKNYRRTKLELTNLPVLAVLAHPYQDYKHVVDWTRNVWVSDKMDGLRCLAKCTQDGVTLESRTGQPYRVPHIEAELSRIMRPGDILDGELYVHGPVLQDIKSAVSREDAEEVFMKAASKRDTLAESKPGSAEHTKARIAAVAAAAIRDIRRSMQFHVFDLLLPTEREAQFEQRLQSLYAYEYQQFPEDIEFVKVVTYKTARDEAHLFQLCEDAVTRGYEGIMVRNACGIYMSGKRSSDILKLKLFFDKEFRIIGVIEDKEGMAVFELESDLIDEITGQLGKFSCVMGSHEWRRKVLTEKELYIDDWMTVQFQSRYKKTLLPQFPTGKLIREGAVIDGVFVPFE